MQQQLTHRAIRFARFAASLGALRTIGGRAVAALGIFVFVVTTGSTAATAQPDQTSLYWTQTIGRKQAVLNDIDAHPSGTWAVGSDLVDGFQDVRPLALRWDGGRWNATPQPMRSNSTLESVVVAGADDVWAVGEDRTDPSETKPLVMHWDGETWQIVPGPSVPAGSFGDVAVGPGGVIWTAGWARIDGQEHAVVYRYVEGSWQALTAGLEQSINGNALSVISENDAWVGLNAGIAHYDGKRWELVGDVPNDGSQIPTALAAVGSKDVWAVGVQHTSTGERPLVLHYNGFSWTRVSAPNEFAQLYDVVLHNGRPVAVGERFERTGDIIVAKPIVLEHRGSKFVRAPSPTNADGTLTSVDASGGRLWAAGLVFAAPAEDPSTFAAFTR